MTGPISAVAVAVGLLWVLGSSAGAASACLPPEITVEPSTVAPGQAVTVSGRHFVTECNDVVMPGEPPPPASPPATDIEIAFAQGERSVVLATVDADDDGSFRTSAIVPADAAPGPATMRATDDGLNEAEAALTVSGPAVAELPRTGVPTAPLAAAGAVLTAFGLWAGAYSSRSSGCSATIQS
jgi:hypothetical protein